MAAKEPQADWKPRVPTPGVELVWGKQPPELLVVKQPPPALLGGAGAKPKGPPQEVVEDARQVVIKQGAVPSSLTLADAQQILNQHERFADLPKVTPALTNCITNLVEFLM